jgi:bifunctional DNA-binding transcriptional regulator/antitoxin component of YhaV-PrlF toxin-antitoxin module
VLRYYQGMILQHSRAFTRTIVSAVLMAALVARAPATSIVVIRGVIGSKWVVLIAADSKSQYIRGQGPATTCKIEPLKRGFLILTGYRTDFKSFSIPVTVRKEFDAKGSFSEHVNRTTDAVRRAATVQLRKLRSGEPDAFKQILTKQHGNVVAIALVDGDALAVRGFRFDEPARSVVAYLAEDCPGKDCPKGNILRPLGKTAAIQKYLSEHHLGVITDPKQLAELARTLIELEVKDAPEDVGPPVEILQLDASGPRWISNDLGCPVQK